jgi:hypothetical protein
MDKGLSRLEPARDISDPAEASLRGGKNKDIFSQFMEKHQNKVRKILAEVVAADKPIDEEVARRILIERHMIHMINPDGKVGMQAAKELASIFDFRKGDGQAEKDTMAALLEKIGDD